MFSLVNKGLFPVAVLGIVITSAGCAVAGRAAEPSLSRAAATAATTNHPIPGTDAAIQRWYLSNGAVKVLFNDALLGAEQAVASSNAPGCKRLDVAARALSAVLPKLAGLSPAGQGLAAAMQPALTTFATAAQACLAGNFAAAQTALDAGIVEQADGQATVDEILDGDL